MSTFLILVGFLVFWVGVVMLIIATVRKKPKQKLGIITVSAFVVMVIGGVIAPPVEETAEVDTESTEVTKVKEDTQTPEVKKAEEEAAAKEEADKKAKADAKAKEEAVKKEKVEAEKKAKVDAKAAEEAAKTPTDRITSIVTDKLKKKTNMDKVRIIGIEDISDSQDGSYIIAKLNASENLTNNMTKSSIWLDSKKILEPISKLETTKKIVLQWHLPLTDSYGETKDGLVMTIDLEREQLDKIKWDNFNGENFSVISNNYFEHPAFGE